MSAHVDSAPLAVGVPVAPQRIPVTPAGSPAYDILVGTDLFSHLPGLCAGSRRVFIVYTESVAGLANSAASVLRGAGADVHLAAIPDAEAAKTTAVMVSLWDALAAIGSTRDDTIVGVGGGAVTDLAGFLAATWLRGINVVQIPTTVLGMVDAAVGGKTGINIDAGKNLVGAFHQPAGVLCDLNALRTLPADDLTAGLAEVIKTGFIADPVILDLFDADPTGAQHLPELITRSIAVKAQVVSADPHEAGRREILNYGHTFGHAVEKVEDYRWRHGAAVSVGLVFAAALGRLAGYLDAPTAARHAELLEAAGLPVHYAGSSWPALRAAMGNDKKKRGDRLRFIVLDGLARPVVLDSPEPELLEAAYAEVRGLGGAT